MESDELEDKRRNLAAEFERVFHRVLSGEKFDLYRADVSPMFQTVATHLLDGAPGREWHWYDGVADLTANVRKRRRVEFNGAMWVGDVGDGRKQWKEEFRAVVTDRRNGRQEFWITIWIGLSMAEGSLATAFGIAESA